MQTMINRYTLVLMKFMLFVFIITLYACGKKGDDHIYNLKVSYKTNNLYCYPEKKILWSFLLDVENGVPPYNYNWISPEITYEGDTVNIDLTNNPVIHLEIEDAEKNWGKLTLKIRNDTIDSLKYDYRNQFIGEYIGLMTEYYYDWHMMPAPVYTSVTDTFLVQKAEKFSQVKLKYRNLDFDFNTRTFSYVYPAYSYTYIHNDTLYYYAHSGLYDSYHFTGIKIKGGNSVPLVLGNLSDRN